MENSEVLLALAHPSVAFLIGVLLAIVARFEHKQGYFLFFAAAFIAYGVGVLMQIVLVPPQVSANIMLSGVLYLTAALLYCRGLFQLGERPMPWMILGAVVAVALLVRGYFTFVDPNNALRAGMLQAFIFLMMFITCWRIRHLRRGLNYERLLFWLVLGFALSFIPRTLLLSSRDITHYGYDSSPYWLAVQITFYAFNVLIALVLLMVAAGRAVHLIRQASYLDPLTLTNNRAGFRIRTKAKLVNCDQYGLIILDLDHFKLVNDRHGHAIGDQVLKAVGALLNKKLRPQDIVSRYGGEEFLICLPDTDAVDTNLIATRLCRAVESMDLSMVVPGLRVTVSAGVGTFDTEVLLEDAYAEVDALLYRAKAGGRNQAWNELGRIPE